MLELHLDKQPPVGTAHNDCSLACIIPRIKISDVAAVYQMKKFDWYFYDVKVISLLMNDVLFSSDQSFRKENYAVDETLLIRLIDFKNAEEYYRDSLI